MRKGNLNRLCAHRTRTIRMCSFDVRSGDASGHPSFIYNSPQVLGGERGKRRKSETPDPEVYGARLAVGNYRLGGGGGVDGSQYAGPVLAMDVSRVVGDRCDHCGRD